MRSRRLLVVGFAAGFSATALLGLGPVEGDAESPAPPAALQRIAALNGDAATTAQAAARQRSEASAEAADARIMREVTAAD